MRIENKKDTERGNRHLKKLIKYKKGQPYPLGVTKTSDGVQFCAVTGPAKSISLCIFNEKNKMQICSIDVTEDYMYGSVASVLVEDIDTDELEYYYEVDGEKKIDDYTVCLKNTKRFGTNIDFENVKSAVLKPFDWQGTKNPGLPMGEVILYRMHARGFTKHVSSKAQFRGTFMGIMEKIPYLIDLGINQIELMPVYEFVDAIAQRDDFKADKLSPQYKCNYWGYSLENRYFSVKNAYAYSSDASKELKELVRELHKNNMEIIFEFYFTKDISVSFILDCLRFWTCEYMADGFHLTGEMSDISEIVNDPYLSDVKIYANYLCEISDKNKESDNNYNRHFAISTEQYKQAVRSFLKSDMGRSEETAYLMRKDDKYYSSVNYICSHDGFTMYDMVSYEKKHNEANGEDNLDGTDYNFSWNCGAEGKTRKKKILSLRKRQMKNAWVMLMFSKGIPAILAGDELCNSQEGNNNAYCQDNVNGWINWNPPRSYDDMQQFVKKLISIRKSNKNIWCTNEWENTSGILKNYPFISYHGEKPWNMEFHPSDRHFAIMYYDKKTYGRFIYIALNMNWMPQKFALPKIPEKMGWYRVVNTAFEENEQVAEIEVESEIVVEERACVVLISKLKSKKNGRLK